MIKNKNGYKIELKTLHYLEAQKHQQSSKVLYTFITNKYEAYLLNIEPSSLVFLKICNTEFDEVIITFTNQDGRPLKIEE